MGQGVSKDGNINKLPQLSESEINLLMANTHFTREQILNYHHDFLHDCPNGKLTKKDFVKFFKSLHPNDNKKAKADNYCEYVFKAFDRDNNGFIDFAEFVIAFSITSFGDIKEKAQFAFKIFDLDKNNRIDKVEMLKVIESLYDLSGIPVEERQGENAPKIHVENIMKRLDVNKDNVISLNEFVDGCVSDSAIKQFLLDPLFK